MKKSKRRNWVANAPIMRKGGVHDKSNKAKRQKAKQAFKRKIRADQFGSFLFGIRNPDLIIRYFLSHQLVVVKIQTFINK